MKKAIVSMLLITSTLLLIISLTSFVSAETGNATMTVEVNILGFANESNASDVSIEVPDYINLGDVTKDSPVSDEKHVYINNTGKLPITVTPQLTNEDSIFSYLYFREQQADHNNILNISRKIGDFSMDINKPAAGKRCYTDHFYIKLNLTDFDGDIKEDLIGYKTDIVFLAMPQ